MKGLCIYNSNCFDLLTIHARRSCQYLLTWSSSRNYGFLVHDYVAIKVSLLITDYYCKLI